MTLGEKIRLYRREKKLSQKEVEIVTGIPQTTLSGWENDKTEPGISDFIKLAAALKVSMTDLLADQEELFRTG